MSQVNCDGVKQVPTGISTPKGLHPKAQGRAAPPGSTATNRLLPRRGCINSPIAQLMEPLRGTSTNVVRQPRVRCATLGFDIQPLRGKAANISFCIPRHRHGAVQSIIWPKVFRRFRRDNFLRGGLPLCYFRLKAAECLNARRVHARARHGSLQIVDVKRRSATRSVISIARSGA